VLRNRDPRKITVPHFYSMYKYQCETCRFVEWHEDIGAQERERDDRFDVKGWLYKRTYVCRTPGCDEFSKFSIFIQDKGQNIPPSGNPNVS